EWLELGGAGGDCGDRCPAAKEERGGGGSLRGGRAQADRAAGGGVGTRGGGARSGRDPADQHGYRRDARRVRLRADGGGERGGADSGDCERGRGLGGALCGGVWAGQGRRCAGGEHLSFWGDRFARAEGAVAASGGERAAAVLKRRRVCKAASGCPAGPGD